MGFLAQALSPVLAASILHFGLHIDFNGLVFVTAGSSTRSPCFSLEPFEGRRNSERFPSPRESARATRLISMIAKKSVPQTARFQDEHRHHGGENYKEK